MRRHISVIKWRRIVITFAISILLKRHARCKGVIPTKFLTLGVAPRSRSIRTTFLFENLAALRIEVFFLFWPFHCRTSFCPPSMVYISVSSYTQLIVLYFEDHCILNIDLFFTSYESSAPGMQSCKFF